MRAPGRRLSSALGGLASLLGWCIDPAAAQIAEDVGDQGDAEPAYPTVYIERTLTLPALMTQASLAFRYWWVDDEENVATTRATATFGLTDWWQASATTRWFVEPEREWGEAVTVASRVQALDTARVDVAPDLEVSTRFDGDRDTEAIPAVSVGALTRIRILKRSALYVADDVVTFGLADEPSASVDINAAVVFQHGDHVATRASAQLMHIQAYGDGRESGGPNRLAVSVIVSPAWWVDLWAGFELGSSSDGLFAGVAGRL